MVVLVTCKDQEDPIRMKALERSLSLNKYNLSHIVRKPAFCICENKDADQRLCFRYTDSTIPLLSKSEISSL